MKILTINSPLQTKSSVYHENKQYIQYYLSNSELKRYIPTWCVVSSFYSKIENPFLKFVQEREEEIKKLGLEGIYLYNVVQENENTIIRWDYIKKTYIPELNIDFSKLEEK